MARIDSVGRAELQYLYWSTNGVNFYNFGVVTGGSIEEAGPVAQRRTISGGSRTIHELVAPQLRVEFLPYAQTNSMLTVVTDDALGAGNLILNPWGSSLIHRSRNTTLKDWFWPGVPLNHFDAYYGVKLAESGYNEGVFEARLYGMKVNSCSMRCAVDEPFSVSYDAMGSNYDIADLVTSPPDPSLILISNDPFDWYHGDATIQCPSTSSPTDFVMQSFELNIDNNLRPIRHANTCNELRPLAPHHIIEGDQEIRLRVETRLPFEDADVRRFSNIPDWKFTWTARLPQLTDDGTTTNANYPTGISNSVTVVCSNLRLVGATRSILSTGVLGYTYEFETAVNDQYALGITNRWTSN